MAVQAKEPISEAKTKVPSGSALRDPRRAALLFMAPDVDVVLKPLIQSLQQSLVPILKQLIKSAPGFPSGFPS